MMHDFESILQVIQDTECEPFTFRLDCILCVRAGQSISSTWGSTHNPHNTVDHVYFVQAKLWRKDTDTGEFGWGQGAKYFLSPYMSTSEITRVCLKACLAYAEHEVREAFQYRGKRIYGPHLSASGLMTAAEDMEVRDQGRA